MKSARKKSIPYHRLTIEEVVQGLCEDKFLDEFTATKILKETRLNKHHPLVVLDKYKIPDRRNPTKPMSLAKLTEWLASKTGMEFVNINPLEINIESVSQFIPHAYAKRLQIVPLKVTDKTLTVATSQPYDREWVDEIQRSARKEIVLKLATSEQIKIVLEEIYVVQKAFSKMGKDKNQSHYNKLIREGKMDELNSLLEKGKQKGTGDQNNSIVQVVDWLINYAFNERASDIHLEPKKGLGQIRFRVDGKLKVVYKMDPESMLSVISRLKILGDLKLDEKRKAQDGRIKRFLENGKTVEMRLSIVPTHWGEKLVMRIFDPQVASKDLDFIGFTDSDRKLWEETIHSSQGLVLVTGPTGSGKTTTLYTSLGIVSTDEVNVCTVEDPIEMTVDSFNQVQVNPAVNMTFAESVKSFLRQDPDIIMVGEIRDLPTGEVAIQASLTGHLVFSTLHTNGALATIQRLIDLGLPSFLINSSLKVILAQRLVRKLCPHCKQKVTPSKDGWETLKDDLEVKIPESVYKPVGCFECRETGYAGRMCIYELLNFNEKIKKIVHNRIEMTELKEKSKGLFTPFRMNCIKAVVSGETSIEEVLKVVY